jgi:3-phosphoglycerate kinase
MNFAQQLAQHAELFINDAFADYRESASTTDVATLLPSLIGPVFAREVKELNTLMEPNRPMVAVLG